jgi:hypothetical protein
MMVLHARGHDDLRTRNTRSADAVHDHFDLADLLADDLERVYQRRQDDDRRAVLIVVKDGDVEFFLQSFFDLKTTRRGDVFKIDPAERRRDCFHSAHDLVGVFQVQTDRKRVYAAEFLEQHRLAFHYRQGGCWSNVAETQDRGAVGDDGDGVLFDRQRVGLFGISIYRVADAGDAGSVGHRKIGASFQRHFGNDFNLAAKVHQERRIGDLQKFNTVDVFHGLDDLFAVRA